MKTTRNSSAQAKLITFNRENIPHGEPWVSQYQGVRKAYETLVCVCQFGGVFKEAGLCYGLNAVEKPGNSMIGILINVRYWEGRMERH